MVEGGEGGRGVLKGGGFGWDPPPPRVPLWSLSKAGPKILTLNPLGTEGAGANFGCQPQTLEGEEGGGEGLKWGGVAPLLLRCMAVLIHHCPPPPPPRSTCQDLSWDWGGWYKDLARPARQYYDQLCLWLGAWGLGLKRGEEGGICVG